MDKSKLLQVMLKKIIIINSKDLQTEQNSITRQ